MTDIHNEIIREMQDVNEKLRAERDRATILVRSIVSHWNEFGPYNGFEETVDLAERWLERRPPPTDEHRTSRGILMAVSAGVIIWGIVLTLWKAFT